jgi:heme/copper-type cytochrome/quinol oxidase subunit 1
MLFCFAFLLQFLLAGLTGIMVAVAPFDWQLHDSHFVVAHFHYTLVGGLVTGLLAGMHYWFPKVTGKMYNEMFGKWCFWPFVIGFNMTFLPLHVLGILGMPRRIFTYPPGRGREVWNLIASIGAAVMAAGILCFIWNIVQSARLRTMIHGTGGRWNGPPALPHPNTISKSCPVVRSNHYGSKASTRPRLEIRVGEKNTDFRSVSNGITRHH